MMFPVNHPKRKGKTQQHLFVFLILIVIILSIFGQTLHFPFFTLDDHAYVTQNGDIRRLNFEMVKRWFLSDYVLLYIPVTIASFAVDYHIWHLNPFGYRFSNTLIHLLNSFLVYYLLLQLTGNLLIALGVSFIFAVHPVQIESVVWISERKNLLSTLFLLIAFWRWIRQKLSSTFLFYLLAILSKPNVVVFPVLLCFYFYFFKPKIDAKKFLFLMFGMLGVSVFCGWMTVKSHSVEQEIFFRGGTFLSNASIMMVIFFKYIRLLLFPYYQRIFYMNEIYRSLLDPRVVCAALGLLLLFFVLGRGIQKKSEKSFWFLWYLIFLLPVSNLVTPIGTLMNDRYLYVPLIGFFVSVFMILQEGSRGILFNAQSGKSLIASTVLLFVLVSSFSLLSYVRAQDWQTSSGVLEADLQKVKYPDARMYTGPVSNLLSSGQVVQAIDRVNEALRVSPTQEVMLWQIQNYLHAHRPGEAKKLLEALAGMSQMAHPYALKAFYGLYYFEIKEYDQAKRALREAIQMNPRMPATYRQLAQVYMSEENLAAAVEILKQGLQRDPDSEEILSELLHAYLHQKDEKSAYAIYLQMQGLYPENALVKQISDQMKRKLNH